MSTSGVFFHIPAVIHRREEQQKGQNRLFALAFCFNLSKDFPDASLDIISVC